MSEGTSPEIPGLPSEGVLRLLRERITARVAAQLDPASRVLSSMSAVTHAVQILASQIRQAAFLPELLISWRDPEYTYRGSDTVASLLGHELAIPTRAVDVRERGESRTVIDDCSWMRELNQVLIVDDACYSGSTLLTIADACQKAAPSAIARCGVLTARNPSCIPNLFYADTHESQELLFPWGWSRLITSLYDIYSLFGIVDRRHVSCETSTWGITSIVADDFSGRVRLLQLSPGGGESSYPAARDFDVFLYVVDNSVRISIDGRSGEFEAGQYIFIPREVEYSMHANNGAVLLQLSSRTR